MSPVLKENVLKHAIKRRELEKQMIEMKKEMKGDRLIALVKEDWLKEISLENQAVDMLIDALKDINYKPVTIHKKEFLKQCNIPGEEKNETDTKESPSL